MKIAPWACVKQPLHNHASQHKMSVEILSQVEVDYYLLSLQILLQNLPSSVPLGNQFYAFGTFAPDQEKVDDFGEEGSLQRKTGIRRIHWILFYKLFFVHCSMICEKYRSYGIQRAEVPVVDINRWKTVDNSPQNSACGYPRLITSERVLHGTLQ